MLTFLFAASKVTNWVDAIGVVLKIEARKTSNTFMVWKRLILDIIMTLLLSNFKLT